MTHFKVVKTGKKLSCAPKLFFQGIKSKKFDIFYRLNLKIRVFCILCYVFMRIEQNLKVPEPFKNIFGKLTAFGKIQLGILSAYEFGQTKEEEFGETKAPPLNL